MGSSSIETEMRNDKKLSQNEILSRLDRRVGILGEYINSLKTMKMMNIITYAECDKIEIKINGIRNGVRMSIDVANP